MDTETPTRSPEEREKLHQEAERRWATLGRAYPELAVTIAVGRGLVALYIDALPAAGRVTLDPAAARAKLAAGEPLLDGEDVDFDLPGLRHFFLGLCEWAGQQPELAAGAARTRQTIEEGELALDGLLAVALNAEGDALDAIANQLGIEPALLTTLTGFTVSAALMGTAHVLAPLVAQEGVAWDAPICPVCGGPPLLAELQGSGGERILRCAACGAGWRYPPTRCAHCGTEDPKWLHFLAAEGQESTYRVDLCDRCHGSLKSVTSSTSTPPELLTIEDAALLHLDAAARERGYTPTPDVETLARDGVDSSPRSG